MMVSRMLFYVGMTPMIETRVGSRLCFQVQGFNNNGRLRILFLPAINKMIQGRNGFIMFRLQIGFFFGLPGSQTRFGVSVFGQSSWVFPSWAKDRVARSIPLSG